LDKLRQDNGGAPQPNVPNVPPAVGPDQAPRRFTPSDRRPDYLRGDPPSPQKTPGLLAYWSFDEWSGDQARDVTGNHPATLHGGRWVQGVRGNAVWLTAPDEYIDYGDAARLNFAAGAPFTFAGWLQTIDGFGIIVSQRNRKDGGPDIEIGV